MLLYNEALEELGANAEEISDSLKVMTGQSHSGLKYVQIISA